MVDNVDAQASNSPVDIPEGLTKEWILEKSKHLNDEFKKWSDTWMPSIDENYKLFEGKPIAGMRPGAIPIPLPNSIIDTNMARFMSAISGREKIVDAIQKTVSIGELPTPPPIVPPMGQPPTDMAPPSQPISPEMRVMMVEDLVNEAITSVPDFMDKCDEMFKLLLLETVSVVECFWDGETYLDRVLNRDMGPDRRVVPVGEGYEELEREFPNFTPVSLRSLAWSPREQWKISKSPWIRKRSMVSVDQLMELERDGVIEGVDEVLQEAPKASKENDSKDPDAQRAKNVEGKAIPNIEYSDALFQMDEWWATLVYKNNGKLETKEVRYWIVGDKVLVAFSENVLKPQRKPFLSAKLNRKPGMLMAQGPMDVVKPIIVDIANVMVSKNLLIRAAANTPTFFEPSSGLDARKTILQENAMVSVLNVRGILPGTPPTAAIGLLDAHIRYLISLAREATSANDMAQGVGTADADTATEAKIMEAGASARFQYNFEMVMNSIFAPMAYEFFLMFKQFGEDTKMTVREAGIDGKATMVTVDDLKGDYEFRAVATQAMQNRMGRYNLLKSTLTELMTVAAQDPSVLTTKTGETMKLMPYEFITEQMLPLVDVKGPGTLFRNMTPQEQMQAEQQKQMKMMMAMQGGAPNPSAPPTRSKPTVGTQPGAE